MSSKTAWDSSAELRSDARSLRVKARKARRGATLEQVVPSTTPIRRVQVWDLPVRLFHWALVAAVTVAVISGEVGGDWMDLHGKAGLAIVGLVAFRLVWGVFGSTNARFLHFAPTPSSLRAYLRGRWKGHGHNPLGALSVFALLAFLAVQAGTGLFGNDDIAFAGPLYALIDETLAGRLTGLHRQLAYGLLALIGLHVVAIVIYLRVKKDNLVKPMVTGWKHVRGGDETPVRKGSWPGLVLAVAVGVGAVYLASGAANPKPAVPAAPVSAPAGQGNANSPPAW